MTLKQISDGMNCGVATIVLLIILLFVSNYLTRMVSYKEGYIKGKEVMFEMCENDNLMQLQKSIIRNIKG